MGNFKLQTNRRSWFGAVQHRYGKHHGGKIERPLRPEQKRRRAEERSRQCHTFPGCTVLGREGRVSYPNRYGWVDVVPGKMRKWQKVGKLYQ